MFTLFTNMFIARRVAKGRINILDLPLDVCSRPPEGKDLLGGNYHRMGTRRMVDVEPQSCLGGQKRDWI